MSIKMEKIIISAGPWSHFGRWPGTTHTYGTYTLEYRGGFWYRLWRCLKTIRPTRVGWTCNLRLPNKGIFLVPWRKMAGQVLSVHGFNPPEWGALFAASMWHDGPVELNISCPNAGGVHLTEMLPWVRRYSGHREFIAKLPPARWMQWAQPLYDAGVRAFHCCNAMRVPCGSLSGKALKTYSLWAVEELRAKWGKEVTIIGGGGVTSRQEVREYLNAGADHVAVGSLLLNPLKWGRVRELVEEANK